jgi:metacaspase-1
MPRAVSIHIGVNQPGGERSYDRLRQSEEAAWKMAVIASQAGFGSVQLLRGGGATRWAVDDALRNASRALESRDVLFLSFSGHGGKRRSLHDASGYDESWCLADGEVLDKELFAYWKLFKPGVRIIAVVESCFSGGTSRDDEDSVPPTSTRPYEPRYRDGGSFRDGGGYRNGDAYGHGGAPAGSLAHASPCIASAPADAEGIRASLLVLTATTEDQPACDGLFTEELVRIWDDGRFDRSFCDLYRELVPSVRHKGRNQDPQLFMMGAPDLRFPMEPAFRMSDGPRNTDDVRNYRSDGPETRTSRSGDTSFRGRGG